MLTIKHVHPSGQEYIYETSHVEVSKLPSTVVSPGEDVTVWRYDASGRAYDINEGTVYVMNTNGSTVATYRLAWPGLVGATSAKPSLNEGSQIGGPTPDQFPLCAA